MSVLDDANTGSFSLQTLQQKRLSEQKGSNVVCKLNLTQLMKRQRGGRAVPSAFLHDKCPRHSLVGNLLG
jgi:hypothetical protein